MTLLLDAWLAQPSETSSTPSRRSRRPALRRTFTSSYSAGRSGTSLPATTDDAEFLIRVLREIRGSKPRGPSVHSQVIGDFVVTTFDGEVDGVLACRQRRQQQIHAIFGGSSHRNAI